MPVSADGIVSDSEYQRVWQQTAKEWAAENKEIDQKLRYHRLESDRLTRHIRYTRRGRPGPDTPIRAILWQIEARMIPDAARIARERRLRSCYVLGTNIPDTELPDLEVIAGYRGQGAVNRGFSFLRSPAFSVFPLFVKKPSRIVALSMVMTLALLVYSVTQRSLTERLGNSGETISNYVSEPAPRYC